MSTLTKPPVLDETGQDMVTWLQSIYNALVAGLAGPSADIPQMDGTGSAGSAATWPRSDHVHPRDPKLDLHADGIPGAAQAVTWDSYGNVTTVTHSVGGVTVRTDSFTYSGTSITETRTLATGESLVLITDLRTWATAATYTAA